MAADYFWEDLVAGGGGGGGGGLEVVGGGGLQLMASQSGGGLGSQVRRGKSCWWGFGWVVGGRGVAACGRTWWRGEEGQEGWRWWGVAGCS